MAVRIARRRPWTWSIPGIILVALVAAFFNPPDQSVTSGDFEVVERVVDGDTIPLQSGERVRLIGVDTPETKHPKKPVEYFGKEASAFTRSMMEGSGSAWSSTKPTQHADTKTTRPRSELWPMCF
jgi:micrococcal nuclease